MRLLLDHAAENGYGIPAFYVNNMEQIQAIMQAAAATDSPVILQASRGARKYAGENFLRHLITAAVETYPHIPIVMHQDHGNEPATCYSAIRNGFTSVMMDGSLEADAKTPATYEYNVNVTAEVVKVAHSIGASVEGELGCLGSLETGKGEAEDGHGFEGELDHSMLLTDPDEAVDFVERTQVDALAVAIGLATALTNLPANPPAKFSLLAALKKFITAYPILTWSCTVLPRFLKISSIGVSCSKLGSACLCAVKASKSATRRPLATAKPSTTVITPSTVAPLRISGQRKA